MKIKNNFGITLISLVLTIIVLLILAGVTILTLTGDNGILKKSQKADDETNKQTATEILNLKITNAQIQSYSETQSLPTLQYLANRLCEDEEMQYVELETQKTAKLNEITVGEANYIYTKLKEYPYEFQIDSKLRLASIDGIKVADSNSKNFEELENEVKNMKENYETIKNDFQNLKEDYENLKNENKILKPGSPSSGSLLMTSNYNKNKVESVHLNSFTNTFTNSFYECFDYNTTTGELTCKKDGWYIFIILVTSDGTSSWGANILYTIVNNVTVQHVQAVVGVGSYRADSSDSLSLFLKTGDKVQFTKTTENASPETNVAGITLLKL